MIYFEDGGRISEAAARRGCRVNEKKDSEATGFGRGVGHGYWTVSLPRSGVRQGGVWIGQVLIFVEVGGRG
jgi:hypothetical protein